MRVGQNLRFEVGSVTYTGTGDISSTSNNIATIIVGSTVAGVVVVMIIVIIPIIIFIVVFFMRRTATKYLVQRETDDSLRGTRHS